MEKKEKHLSRKAEVLLKAMKSMSDLSEFENRVKDLTKIEIYELQPSLTSGLLFDLLTDEILTSDGVDILNAYLFDPLETYSEENPFSIYDVIDGVKVEYKIGSPEELCLYLDNNRLFRYE